MDTTQGAAESRMRHIVVGTDFSELAESVVDQAVELAGSMGATVTIVHAYETPMLSLPDGVAIPSAELSAKLTNDEAKRLRDTGERFRDSKVRVGTSLRMGPAWEELNAVAVDQHADLIVVGTHGRRGLARAFLGSVADRVIRTATVPVLVLRAPKAH